MGFPFQSRTRLQVRQAVGYLLGSIFIGEAGTGSSTDTLKDTMLVGGNEDYNGRDFYLSDASTKNIGARGTIISYSPMLKVLKFTPALTSGIASGNDYELWETFTVPRVNEAINQAIRSATDDILVNKQTFDTYKLAEKYEYNCLSGFVALHTVEYEYEVGVDRLIHNCDRVWDELTDTDVTATLDTTNYQEGSGALKLVVAANCGAGDILATDDITSLDISDCDQIVLWVHSTTALDAGDLQVLLDNTASCASPAESLDIPATTANIWTRHTISLANPLSDTAIISVGIKMVTDKGAFTVRVDDIRAEVSKSRLWHILGPDMWYINSASTPLLGLTQTGFGSITNNTPLRLTGYAIASELTTDSSSCEIDSDYVVAYAASTLMASNFKPVGDNIDEGRRLMREWFGIAEMKKLSARTSLEMNTRWVG